MGIHKLFNSIFFRNPFYSIGTYSLLDFSQIFSLETTTELHGAEVAKWAVAQIGSVS